MIQLNSCDSIQWWTISKYYQSQPLANLLDWWLTLCRAANEKKKDTVYAKDVSVLPWHSKVLCFGLLLLKLSPNVDTNAGSLSGRKLAYLIGLQGNKDKEPITQLGFKPYRPSSMKVSIVCTVPQAWAFMLHLNRGQYIQAWGRKRHPLEEMLNGDGLSCFHWCAIIMVQGC